MKRALLFVACLISVAGCWGGNELGMVPVRGTITFAGEKPPAEGRISFSPMEPAPGKPNRPGNAQFSTDGSFRVTSFQPGDGLVPGTYRVKVSCLKGNIGETMSQAQIDNLSHVPKSFEPPELVIEPGSGTVTFDIDVTKSD